THVKGAGAGRVAQSLSRSAVPLGRGFRAGRSIPPPRRSGDGAGVLAGGSAPRAVAARRDAHAVKLHRTSVTDASRRFRHRLRGTQRLGTRSEQPVAEILHATPRATRRYAARAVVR